ncbi:MAG TPA: response regulator [Bryobacteraceae bacterium]|nr:response regulator [Bryobacteraceae bacterium]
MSDPQRHKQPTVLVVEDDEQVRAFLCSLLTTEGYSVVQASTGEEGLQKGLKSGCQIDLLLSDMLLPELSGFDLAERLMHACPQLRVLFITGYVEGDIVQRSVDELGASFLDKPFMPSALLQRVREAIGSPKAVSQ